MADLNTGTPGKNVSVRFPGDLYEKIRESAKTDRRSINSQILALIEAGLAARG